MKYLGDSFSVGVGGKKYAQNWERIFGKKKDKENDKELAVKTPSKKKKHTKQKKKKKHEK
jgi:hypothetical protein